MGSTHSRRTTQEYQPVPTDDEPKPTNDEIQQIKRQLGEIICASFLNEHCLVGPQYMTTMTEFSGRLNKHAIQFPHVFSFDNRDLWFHPTHVSCAISFDIRNFWLHPTHESCAFFPSLDWWNSKSVEFVSQRPHTTRFFPILVKTSIYEHCVDSYIGTVQELSRVCLRSVL